MKNVVGDGRCVMCGKNRPIFKLTQDLISAETVSALERAMELHLYSCGSNIVPEDMPEANEVAVQTNLSCDVPQSDVYRNSKLFPESCGHCMNCGIAESLTTNATLLGQHQNVHPICTFCKAAGKPYPHSRKMDAAKTASQQARVQKLCI